MDKRSIALVLIGIIFGFEGVAVSFIGLFASSEISQLIDFARQESTFFEQQADIGSFQMLNLFANVGIFYGIAKAFVGIFCIATGASELFEAKSEGKGSTKAKEKKKMQ